MTVEVRQAEKSDIGLSFAFTEEAVRQHVEATWGVWEPAEQRLRHTASFDPSNHWIVLADQEPVGVVAAELKSSHVHLSKLYLRTHARGRGVGSLLLSALLRSAARRSQPLRLSVLAVNYRAQAFYVKHGFCESSRTAERVFMEARPNPSIERTVKSRLRLLSPAAHVQR